MMDRKIAENATTSDADMFFFDRKSQCRQPFIAALSDGRYQAGIDQKVDRWAVRFARIGDRLLQS